MEVTPAGQSDVQQTSSSSQESESSKEVRVEGSSVVESSSTSSRSVQQSVTQRVMSSSMVKQSSFSSTSVSSSQQNDEGAAGAAVAAAEPQHQDAAWEQQQQQQQQQQQPPPQEQQQQQQQQPPPQEQQQQQPDPSGALWSQQPVKDCSDLPQDNIKSSLKEIISDLERADLADSVVESVITSDISQERRSKMDRQTSTTTLEQVLLKDHQIAQELNMLSRTEEVSEVSEDSNHHEMAEEEHFINHIPDEDRSRGGSAHPAGHLGHPGHPGHPGYPHIDLERLFTPATDSGESTPARKSRMYASSSFYGPEHPTVEEQVELARRISTSLSDISNQRSKGQTMYVNRKKRSVGWVHQATDEGTTSCPSTPYDAVPPGSEKDKPVLKLVMDPRGQVQDLWSLQKQGVPVGVDPSCGALSPEVCFHLVRDLNAPKGKGAELFAKRRKKSEKWVVDETTVKTTSMESTSPAPKLPVPAASYLANGTTKVHNVQRMNEIQEKFSQPRLKLVKSPWEAALETGSVDGAFQASPVGPGTAPLPPPRTPAMPPVGTPTWTATTTAATVRTRPLSMTDSSLYSGRTARGWGQQSQQQYGDSALMSFRAPEEPAPLLLREAQGPAAPPASAAPAPPPRTVFYDYTLLQNYNTAPRGWGQSMDFYRPITFTKPIAATDL